jgi:hypothetical protein
MIDRMEQGGDGGLIRGDGIKIAHERLSIIAFAGFSKGCGLLAR